MDLKSIVFNAAEHGKLYRLKVFTDHKPREEVKMLVSSFTNDTTPLLIACRNGHLDVAVYLIEKCNADVEQIGCVCDVDLNVDGVPPLWCAAASGHLNIVKCLVKLNAPVNQTTITNCTPLRAACSGGDFEIVKYLVQHGADIQIPDIHGHTCLMISCLGGHYDIAKYLIECGANINERSSKGNTAMHDCAESGNLELLKLLLAKGGVSLADSLGTTPILSAAIAGHAHIVRYFVSTCHCQKSEKADGLELLGATFLDKKQDMRLTLDCWRTAMELRHNKWDRPVEKLDSNSRMAYYMNTREVHTFEEIEALRLDPDEMRIQALLITERVLGPAHPNTLHYVFDSALTYLGNGNFQRCIQLWIYTVDVQQRVHMSLSAYTLHSLTCIIGTFSRMMSDAHFARGYPILKFCDVLSVFEKTVKEIKTALTMFQKMPYLNDIYSSDYHLILLIALHLIGFMCKLQPHLNKSEELELRKAVYKLVRINPRGKNGWAPLHLACLKDSSISPYSSVITFPSLEIVNLLLEVGACPNDLDFRDNTPLHTIAMNTPCSIPIFKSLLSSGAHLDLCNQEKQTPLQLIQHIPLLVICPLRYINLQCLCAQAIQQHRIPFKGLVHKKLEEFLDAH